MRMQVQTTRTSCLNRLGLLLDAGTSSGQTGLCHQLGAPSTTLASQRHPAAFSAPAQAKPHFPESVVGKGSSFPSSSTENMTSPQLPRGGSVSCSG